MPRAPQYVTKRELDTALKQLNLEIKKMFKARKEEKEKEMKAKKKKKC